MANLLDKEWVGVRITNEFIANREKPGETHQRYMANVTYSGVPLLPERNLESIMNGGEKSETGAVYDLIKVLKELTDGVFEAAKANGLLAGLSLEDIK